jgi:hypothetical protein
MVGRENSYGSMHGRSDQIIISAAPGLPKRLSTSLRDISRPSGLRILSRVVLQPSALPPFHLSSVLHVIMWSQD